MLQLNPAMARPRCKCGAIRERVHPIPGLGWFEGRIFKCDKCSEVELVAAKQES